MSELRKSALTTAANIRLQSAISRPRVSFLPRTRVIRLDNIFKQNGHQILFVEASAALNKGEEIGLVGPNGVGKTTMFRITPLRCRAG